MSTVNVNNQKLQKKGGAIAKVVVIIIILAAILSASFTIVPAGNTGVVLTLGKVSSNTFSEGFHFKVPFVQEVEILSNKIQVYETPSSAVSKDLQNVSSTISVNYRLVSDMSDDMFKNVGTDYQTILISPAVQECMKSISSRYTAEQLITERSAVGDEVKAQLEARLNSYGIYIEKFNIVNFDFSEEFNQAIEAKQVAEQNLLKTKTEQEQAVAIAESQAKQKVIAAKAEADAITAKAQAQANANKLINDSLSEKVITYQQIEKWDGVMPKFLGGDNAGMLFSISADDDDSASTSKSVKTNNTSNTTSNTASEKATENSDANE